MDGEGCIESGLDHVRHVAVDHPAVAGHHDPLADVVRHDPVEGPHDPGPELVAGFGVRVGVPAAGAVPLPHDPTQLVGSEGVDQAPLLRQIPPEVDLAQRLELGDRQVVMSGDGPAGVAGPHHRRAVDRVDGVIGQPLPHRRRLAPTQLGQGRVHGVGQCHVARQRLLAVAHQEDLADPVQRGQEGTAEIDRPDPGHVSG